MPGLAEPVRGVAELAQCIADPLGGQSSRCRPGERGDLQQRAPLAAHGHLRETEPVRGDRELDRQLWMHQVAEDG
jgi:hypothetical protein